MKIRLLSVAVVIHLQWGIWSFVVSKEDKENEIPAGIPQVRNSWAGYLEENLENMEFNQYLSGVFEALQGVDGFYKKMREEFKNEQLSELSAVEMVNFHIPADIRSKLDELKRIEVSRLVKYGKMLRDSKVENADMIRKMTGKLSHLDTTNLDNFGASDLIKLLSQTVKNLGIIDEIKKEAYKKYEMHKHLELEELLKRVSPAHRDLVEKNLEELKKQHKRTKPMYAPLSRPHLHEVWEEMDEMNSEFFNLRTFFNKHDLDGSGFLDENEVKVLIGYEIDKYYSNNNREADSMEVEAEEADMLNSTYEHIDLNKDRLIDIDELIKNVENRDITDIEFWESQGNKAVYTEQEYEEYAKEHRADVIQQIEDGVISLPDSGVVAHLSGTLMEGIRKKNSRSEKRKKFRMKVDKVDKVLQ